MKARIPFAQLAAMRDFRPGGRGLLDRLARSLVSTGLILLVLALLGALAACGGGDPDDQADGGKTIDPPACTSSPEVCK